MFFLKKYDKTKCKRTTKRTNFFWNNWITLYPSFTSIQHATRSWRKPQQPHPPVILSLFPSLNKKIKNSLIKRNFGLFESIFISTTLRKRNLTNLGHYLECLLHVPGLVFLSLPHLHWTSSTVETKAPTLPLALLSSTPQSWTFGITVERECQFFCIRAAVGY